MRKQAQTKRCLRRVERRGAVVQQMNSMTSYWAGRGRSLELVVQLLEHVALLLRRLESLTLYSHSTISFSSSLPSATRSLTFLSDLT